MKIYVRRNISSLNRIAQAVSHFLKCGERVCIKYNNTHERDIIIRFQQRLEKFYSVDDDFDLETLKYPETGYVTYSRSKVVTYEDVPPKYIDVRVTFELVYDPFMLKRFTRWVVNVWDETIGQSVKRYNDRERW